MNKKKYKYEKYLKELPYIQDPQLFKSVAMCLYLIVDINKTLKFALSSASKRHKVKPLNSVEKLVRQALPSDYFTKKQFSNAPFDIRKQSVRYRMMYEMETMARSHLYSIRMEDNIGAD